MATLAPKMRDAATVLLWPNPVPLECGVIRNQSGASEKGTGTSKFTLFNLKKIYTYLKSKGKGAFPNLRYSVWLHIVKNKFGFTDDLAWLYFELFDVVSELPSEERVKVLQAANECTSDEETDTLRKKLSVDTSRFLLFLYVQSTPRLSLKGPSSTGDDWPSPEAERRHQRFPEAASLVFIKQYISEILQLLADTDEATRESYLSVESLSALEFLLCGCQQGAGRESLTALACKYSQDSGYNKTDDRFPVPSLEQWLRAHLTLNPYGPQTVYSQRKETRVTCFSSDGPGRLLANTHTAPQKCGTAVLGRLVNQTLAVDESGISGCDVHIRNCRRSTIYLLSPMRTVTLEKCSHCLLVLGAVKSVVTVSNCDTITVVAACRKVHISSSSLSTFHLLTMTRPLVFPSCFHLCLAPYNTSYPRLGDHLRGCGLSPSLHNHWDNPLLIGTDEDVSVVWERMPPESFRPLAIPFSMEGPTQENPCPLPPSFQTVLALRRETIKRWYDTVGSTQLTEDQRLQTAVRGNFQDWLSRNGYDKDIAALSIRDTPSPSKQLELTN
ncbi:TBCC domain-containing protein 1-like [Halichondria panicea]|uniref:TBCC domain-containing protein 1-like n=1 Tax=Halichondria panicea TaxID=6063 RepID=UPI00312B2C3B